MPSVKCPHCDSVFKLNTEVGEGPVECPMCGKLLEVVRKRSAKTGPAGADAKATTGWGAEGVSAEQGREGYGQLNKGDVLGGFRVEEMLGAGAMAVVYKATQLSLDRAVALKILPTEYARKESFVKQFDSETDLLASLNHPNIVGIIDRGREGDTYFFAMEFVDGITLGELLSTGEVEEEFFLQIMEQCAEALSYAHSRKIIHRDIKPANIMLNEQSMVKITDFGIAGLLADAEADTRRRRKVMGTRGYMPPEQELDVRRTDARSDIFALGAVMYRMLTNQIPSRLPPSPPSKLNPSVDPGFDSVVLKCLEADPARRYQTAKDLLEALRAYHRQIGRAGEVCPQCKKANPVTEKKCLHCGADLSDLFDVCPECAAENRIDVDICRSCGASINLLRQQTSVKISKMEEQARAFAQRRRFEDAIAELEEVLKIKGKVFRRAREKAERLIANFHGERRTYYAEKAEQAKHLGSQGRLREALQMAESVPEEFAESQGVPAFIITVKSRMVLAEKKLAAVPKLIEEQRFDDAAKALADIAKAWVDCPGLTEAQAQLRTTRDTAQMLDYELTEVKNFIAESKFSQAREALQFAIATMPDNPQVKALLSQIERGEKQTLFTNTLNEGQRAFQEGDYRGAVQFWTATTELLPKNDPRRTKMEEKMTAARQKIVEGGVVALSEPAVVALVDSASTRPPVPMKVLIIVLAAVMGAVLLMGGIVLVLNSGE
jgi:serine/threonine protein kinase